MNKLKKLVSARSKVCGDRVKKSRKKVLDFSNFDITNFHVDVYATPVVKETYRNLCKVDLSNT